jgi:hypothetical protein
MSATAQAVRLARWQIAVGTVLVGLAAGGNLRAQVPVPQQPSKTASPCCRPENSSLERRDHPTSLAGPPDSSSASRLLWDLADSRPKFNLDRLMSILRDKRHEGWVRTAYPDPLTGRPLIGGGFSLDLNATEHGQRNPLNPFTFIEPSSSLLWQAAGLDLARLDAILDQFHQRQMAWGDAGFRQMIRAHQLPPDISDEEAMRLLRISALQAIHNARAYSVDFDRMNASQQMALSQLVFQMGVNLEEFVEFLSAINGPTSERNVPQPGAALAKVDWKAVEGALVHSDWARRYTDRAVSVIAMFDPNYARGPRRAERRVRFWIHPPSHHRRKPQGELAGNSSRRAAPRRRTKPS